MSQNRALPHNLGIGADIGGTGCLLGQLCQVGKPTRVFDITGTLQEFGQRDNIKRFAFARQSLGSTKNEAVILAIKVASGNDLRDFIKSAVVQHQATKHRLFGLHGMRWNLDSAGLRVAVYRFEIRVGHGNVFVWASHP